MNEIAKLCDDAASTKRNEMIEFLSKHRACREGCDWAKENCASLAEAWDKAKPEWLIWLATREGVLSDRDLRLFACWSVRQVWSLLTDERSRNAVEVAERFARGEASQEELAAAGDAARAAEAARGAAWAAAWAAEQKWQANYIRSVVANPFAAKVEGGKRCRARFVAQRKRHEKRRAKAAAKEAA